MSNKPDADRVTIENAELSDADLEQVTGGTLEANTSRDTRLDVSRKYGPGAGTAGGGSGPMGAPCEKSGNY